MDLRERKQGRHYGQAYIFASVLLHADRGKLPTANYQNRIRCAVTRRVFRSPCLVSTRMRAWTISRPTATAACSVCRTSAHPAMASTGSVDSQTDSHELLRAGGHAKRWAILAWTVTRIAFWTGVAGWLHRIKGSLDAVSLVFRNIIFLVKHRRPRNTIL